MKQSQLLQHLLRVAGVGAAAATVAGMSADALAGISNTKHNLTLGTNTNRVTAGAGTEICVFCHTPHGADTSAPVPLWNKKLPASSSYTTYAQLGSSTLDAQTSAVGSISLACLSCHDGAQAMDNIINAPGSGGYDSTGGNANGLNYSWSGNVTAAGILNSSLVTNIGADLRNDHPIGISYCGLSAAPTTGSTTNCKDGDFRNVVGSGTAWYVEASGNSTKDKGDMILYWRQFTAQSLPSVECASCHDPHVETKASTEVAFLRKSQASSGLCLACHNK